MALGAMKQRHLIQDSAVALGAVLACTAVSIHLAFATGPAAPNSPVLVVSAPWHIPAVDLVAAAGGQLIGPISGRFGTLAQFSDGDQIQKALGLGAWFVADAAALAALCSGWTHDTPSFQS